MLLSFICWLLLGTEWKKRSMPTCIAFCTGVKTRVNVKQHKSRVLSFNFKWHSFNRPQVAKSAMRGRDSVEI